MTRIVVVDDSPPVVAGTPALQRMQAAAETVLYDTRPSGAAELIDRLTGAHTAVNIRSTSKFTAEVLEALRPSLRHVAVWGTGVDNVDLAAAGKLGIVVSNTPNTATDAIAEHCLATLLAVARRLHVVDSEVKAGRWPKEMFFQCLGKTLGIIGTGVIGTRFAELARAIGMRVIAWTMHPDPAKAAQAGFSYVSSLDQVLSQSDVVSLHLRSSQDTRGMIGAAQFARMKDGAIFMNTARGDIVDEAALVDALRSGKLRGAALDVFTREPLNPDNPLLSLSNVVLTPHIAGATPEALANGLNLCAENVVRFLTRGEVANRVV